MLAVRLSLHQLKQSLVTAASVIAVSSVTSRQQTSCLCPRCPHMSEGHAIMSIHHQTTGLHADKDSVNAVSFCYCVKMAIWHAYTLTTVHRSCHYTEQLMLQGVNLPDHTKG